MKRQRTSLIFEAPYKVSVAEEELPQPQMGQVLVATSLSAISPGTEMLVYRGQLPTEMATDGAIDTTLTEVATAASQYPVRYGYTCVGKVAAVGEGIDSQWIGRAVFAFQPHCSHFVADLQSLLPLPEAMKDEQAIFYPNMETALTFVLDGAPAIGERVCVVGAGIVGLLTTALLARFPLAELTVIDPLPARRQLALHFGATAVYSPEEAAQQKATNADLAYEVSGNPEALNTAIRCTGFAGRVVIGSWYGQKRAAIDLGGYFHRSRIQLIGSQVSSLPPERLARWDRQRRTAFTWEMLRQVDTHTLITHRFAIHDAALAYDQVDRHAAETGQVLLSY